MSQVQADIFSSVGGDTGAMQLPVGTTAERPNSALPGYTRINTTLSTIETYNGSTWLAIKKLAPGTTAATAFDNLSEVAGLYTGQQVLWTTAGKGSNFMPFKVLVDFDQASGPWIIVAPYFTVAGVMVGNRTFAAAGYNLPDDGVFKQGGSRSEDIGFGSQAIYSMFGFWDRQESTRGQIEAETSGGYFPHENTNTNYSWYPIFYYNPATQDFFADDQVDALRDYIGTLNPNTPWVAVDSDSDSNSSGSNNVTWNSYTTSGLSNGHTCWVKDKSGNVQRMQNKFSGNNYTMVYKWTRTTFNSYGTSWAQENGSPSGLISNAMILPSFMKFYVGSGGGAGFGVYKNTFNVHTQRNCLYIK